MHDTEATRSPNQRWANRIIVVLFTTILAPLGLSLLYFYYDPTGSNPFFPSCFFKELTTLNCPGCGATRSLYSLLHLDIMQALAYNPFFVIVLPYLIYSLVGMLYTMWTGKRGPGYRMPSWTSKCLLFAIIAYWILRNIDVFPFNLLAPHDLG